MDPPLTPTRDLGGTQAQRASATSPSSPRRRPQQNDYPLSADNKTENDPMGDRDPGNGRSTTSETRLEPPAHQSSGGPGKPAKTAKRRKNRNRKRRNRQQSFIAPGTEDSHEQSDGASGTGGAGASMEGDRPTSRDKPSFFRLRRNLSDTSIESDALLDHRYATVCFVTFGMLTFL